MASASLSGAEASQKQFGELHPIRRERLARLALQVGQGGVPVVADAFDGLADLPQERRFGC